MLKNQEGIGYQFMGKKAYDNYRQDSILLPHIFQLPPRKKEAVTGSDFARKVLNMTAEQRDSVVYTEIAQGNIPDLIHKHSQLKFIPHPMTPDSTMTTVPIFVRHDSIIEAARQANGSSLKTLVAGHKKDIVITNRIAEEPGRLFIYGWHYQDGRPIQPLSAAHGINYVDYSHGVRLIRDEVLVDGKLYSIKKLLQDPALYKLFSDESGPMSLVRI